MVILLFLLTFLSKDDVGTTMYPLLKIGVGPRAVALGETYVGLADDITSAYWNPAGLADVSGLQFFVSHHEWFLDIRDEYLTMGLPGLNGYFSFGGIYSATQDVEIWDANNMPLGTETLWSGILTVSHGRKIKDNLSLGFGIKAIYEDLYEETLNDFAADFGAQLKLSDKFQIGCALRNLSYTLEVPSDIKLGVCFRGLKQFNLVMDATFPSDNIPSIHAGVEYNSTEYFSARAGWRSGPYDISNLGWVSGFTSGFGIHYMGLHLDYAFVPYGKLGLTHRIGLSGGLQVLQGTNSFIIRVMNGDSNQPLEADLALSGAKNGTFSTSKLGKLEFKNLSQGWVFISAFVPGYPENFDSVYVIAKGKTEKNIYLYEVKPGIFRGLVFDAVTRKPIGATAMYKGMAFGKVNNDPETGSFVLRNLPPGVYTFTVSGVDPAYIAQICSISVARGKLTEREFYLVKKREKIILKGVSFNTGKADLRPESYGALDDAGRILMDNPHILVELAGHTDPREISTTEYSSNWDLSLARAEVVRLYLMKKFNINPDRLTARGYADTQPIAPNTTEEGMAKNRRTEFRIIED